MRYTLKKGFRKISTGSFEHILDTVYEALSNGVSGCSVEDEKGVIWIYQKSQDKEDNIVYHIQYDSIGPKFFEIETSHPVPVSVINRILDSATLTFKEKNNE